MREHCPTFLNLTVPARWDICEAQGTCLLCLRHSVLYVCYKANADGGKMHCGVDGCPEAHHPLLHHRSAVTMKIVLRPRFEGVEVTEVKLPVPVAMEAEAVSSDSSSEDSSGEDAIPSVLPPLWSTE